MVLQTINHTEVPFSLVVESVEGRLRLLLRGELDLACCDLLDSVTGEDDEALREVLLDVTELDFIDTSGVRALAGVRTRNESRGRVVDITTPTPLVRRVVGLMGRTDLLPAV
jgi:anti-anti-sigma factor